MKRTIMISISLLLVFEGLLFVIATQTQTITGSYEITLTDNQLAYAQQRMQETGMTKDEIVSYLAELKFKEIYRDDITEKVAEKLSLIDTADSYILQQKLDECLNIQVSIEQLDDEEVRIEILERLNYRLYENEIPLIHLENFLECVES